MRSVASRRMKATEPRGLDQVVPVLAPTSVSPRPPTLHSTILQGCPAAIDFARGGPWDFHANALTAPGAPGRPPGPGRQASRKRMAVTADNLRPAAASWRTPLVIIIC